MALQRLLIATACCVIPIALWLFLVGTVPAPTSLGSPHLRNRAEEDGGGTASTATHEQEHKPPELPQLGFAQRLAQQLLHQHAASVALPRHSSHPHPHQHQQQLHPHHVNPRMHHGNTTSTSASALRGAAAVAPASLGAKPAATSATLATSGAAAAAAATAASKTAATVLPPGGDPGSCTLGSPRCFNLERCRSGFSLYVYPPARGTPVTCSFGSDSPLSSLDADEVRLYGACFLHTLLNSSGLPLVSRPQDACVLVPSLDANCAFNTCDETKLTQLGAALAALPHWDGGRNHLVFNYNNDWEHARFSVGQAIVARASWVKNTYRRGFDIQLPLTRPKITPPDVWVLAWGEELLQADRRAGAGGSSSGSSILSPWQKLELPQPPAAGTDASSASAAGNASQGVGAQPRRWLQGMVEAPDAAAGAWGEDTEALGGRLWSWDSKLLPAAQQPQHGAQVLQPQLQLEPRRRLQAASAAVRQRNEARVSSPHARHLSWWFWPWDRKSTGGRSGGDTVRGGASFNDTHLTGPLRHDLLLYFNGCLLPRWYDCDATRPRLFDILNAQLPPARPHLRRGVVLQARCCGDHSAGPAAAHCGGCVDNRRSGPRGGMDSCTAAWPDVGFQEGMRRAQFALSPRGCGSQSYRLLEGAGLGTVPVHVGDSTVLPFDGEAGLGRLWAACVVDVKLEEVKKGQLLPRLRRLEEEGGGEGYVARQAACARLAALRSWEVRVVALQAVCTLALRVEAQFAAGAGAGARAGGAGAGAGVGAGAGAGDGRVPDQMRQLCASVGAVP